MRTIYRALFVLAVALAVIACPSADGALLLRQVEGGPLSLAIVGQAPDSVDVAVTFTMPTDPSGISRIDWQNWGTNPVQDSISGSTVQVTDTFRVRKPAEGATDAYAIRARAVDGAGNVGLYSAPHPWAVIFADITAPGPPGIVLDTIVVSQAPAVVDIAIWPDTLVAQGPVELVEGQRAQFTAAVLLDDGTMECTSGTSDVTVAFNRTDWPGACDSAMSRLTP